MNSSNSLFPRMLGWLVITAVLIWLANGLQRDMPGSLWAVTVYKAHLLSLGGWGGYWLDRALFPYDRPHQYLELADDQDDVAEGVATAELVAGNAFGSSMLRRSIIVAACLICVGLGA